jgi:hypothetical protein
MKYRKGYKYQLYEDYEIATTIQPYRNVSNDYVAIDGSGLLTVFKGYAWDGPSGPTFDTKTFMRGSLVHDAIYQLIRHKSIALYYKAYADILLRDICIEDGMNRIRAWYVYHSVKNFADFAVNPKYIKQIIEV